MIGAVGAVLISLAVFSVSTVKASSPVIELSPSFGAFSVTNPGAAASLASAVKVQRLADGKWVDANVTNLYLIETCGAAPPPVCRKLAPKEKVKALPWTGRFCASQCPGSCRLDGPAPPGTYRFVVKSCDGKETFVSPEFKKERQ